MTLLSYTSAAPNPMYIGLDDDTNALTQIFGLSPQYFSTLEKEIYSIEQHLLFKQ